VPLSLLLMTVADRTPALRDVLVAAAGTSPSLGVEVGSSAVGNINPGQGSKALPGSDFLHELASALGSWALIAAVVGIFVGGVMWAFGSYSQNYQQAYSGRKGVLVSGLAALLIGAGPYLVNFFYAQGQGLR
jgi:type IV secretory pathway VirB2 component (pilin)